MKPVILLLTILSIAAAPLFADEVFSRSGDGWGETLTLTRDHFVVEGWRMSGKREKREGSATYDEHQVSLGATLTTKEQRFLRMVFEGTAYLVPPSAQEQFLAMQNESDWHIRTSELHFFFHRQISKRANKST